MIAPTSVGINQVVSVKNACKASADIVALDSGGSIPAAMASLHACVASGNLGAHLIRSGVRFHLAHELKWLGPERGHSDSILPSLIRNKALF